MNFTKAELCKKSYELLLEHRKHLDACIAKFAVGKVPTQDDWARVQQPFSAWKRMWDKESTTWSSELTEFVIRSDLRGDE